VTDPLSGLLGGKKPTSRSASGGSATGLSSQQENSLLSSLIGGF
jgi:hypothetical protein